MVQPAHNVEGEGVHQLKMTMKNLYLKTFDAEIDPNELFHFHYDLWETSKDRRRFNLLPNCLSSSHKSGCSSLLDVTNSY